MKGVIRDSIRVKSMDQDWHLSPSILYFSRLWAKGEAWGVEGISGGEARGGLGVKRDGIRN